MKNSPYDEHIFKTVTGRNVNKLWKLYKEQLGKEGGGGTSASESDVKGPSVGGM